MLNIYQRMELKEFLRQVEPFYGVYDEGDLDGIVDHIEEILEDFGDEN